MDENDLGHFICLLLNKHDYVALGADNDLFYKNMIPAMMVHFEDPSDEFKAIKFSKTWIKSIIEYHHNEIQELLDDACNERYIEEHYENDMIQRQDRDTGEIQWISR